MMQVFRSIAGKVAAAVFTVLMLIFLWTSVDWSQVRGGSRTNVGEINGVGIPLRTYQQIVQNQIEVRQRQSGHSLSAEEVEEVRNAVWDDLVQQQSLEREYRSRGIEVTPEEIATAIAENPLPDFLQRPEFQTDGKFDLDSLIAEAKAWPGLEGMDLAKDVTCRRRAATRRRPARGSPRPARASSVQGLGQGRCSAHAPPPAVSARRRPFAR